jgi:Tol biopolymer transport system component
VTPFFSPDSQHIGFFADGKLKRIPVSGGAPETLCNVDQPAGGTWNRNNVILFSQSGRLYRVSAGGGATTELSRPDAAAGETNIDTWPQFLPDGRRFIVSTATHTGHINTIRTGILIGATQSSKRKLLVSSRSRAAITSSGHLLFRRDDVLVAQKLNLDREQLVGEPLVLAQRPNPASGGILVDVVAGLPVGVVPAPFSASDNGVLVYHSSPPPKRQLVWFNREGKRLGTAGESRDYMQIFLSPDEQWAALSIRDRGSRIHWNIWLLHLKTNVMSRLSFGEGRDADPTWGPDSDRVVFGAYHPDLGEKIDLMEVTLGQRAPKRIYSDRHSNKPEAWSPDRRFLLFRRNEQTVFSLPMSGDRKPAVLLQTPYIKQGFRFSPDGRWLAAAVGDWMSDDPGEVVLLDAATGRTVAALPCAASPGAVTFTSRSELIVGLWDGRTQKWDLNSGRVIDWSVAGKDIVAAAAFSPDNPVLGNHARELPEGNRVL